MAEYALPVLRRSRLGLRTLGARNPRYCESLDSSQDQYMVWGANVKTSEMSQVKELSLKVLVGDGYTNTSQVNRGR